MTQTVIKTGACLCGAVTFRATDVPDKAMACHCRSCQRWTGSAFVEVSVPTGSVHWEGDITVHTSSGWGQRAFCPKCGSHVYFRVTEAGGDFAGNFDIPLGLFEDTSGFRLDAEIYVDHRPETYAFEDKGQQQLTRADCIKIFPLLGSDTSVEDNT